MVQASRLAASLVGLLGFAGLGLAAPLDGRAPQELTDEYCQAAAKQRFVPGMYQCAERNRGKDKDKREPKVEPGLSELQELCDNGDIEDWWCKKLPKREPKEEPEIVRLQREGCDKGELPDYWCNMLPKRDNGDGEGKLPDPHELCDKARAMGFEVSWCEKFDKRDDETYGKVALAAPQGDDEDEDK